VDDGDVITARLDRIGALARDERRGGAAPGQLLAELRSLLREVEASPSGPADDGEREEVVGRTRTARAGDIIDM
jgi:hypothetical protein